MYNWKLLNTIFLYDGTFDGLLTIAFNCYVSKQIPSNIVFEKHYLGNFLDTAIYVKTDKEKASRIWNGLYSNVSFDALYNCYYAFLSCQKSKEINILKYILNAFIIGPKITSMLSIDYILEVMKLRKNVLHESHKLKGLVRLSEVGNNLFYAPIHPDNNVIELLGHFLIKRFPTQNLILHDKNRHLMFLYNANKSIQNNVQCSTYNGANNGINTNMQTLNNYEIIEVPQNIKIPELSKEEKQFQDLWKTFFNTISIKERSNPRLQMQYMPKKYWQDLTELN